MKQVLFRKASRSRMMYERAVQDCGKYDETTNQREREFNLLESVIGECGLLEEFEEYYIEYKNKNKGIYGVK